MAEQGQNGQNNFLIEKIKERPINRGKLIQKMITTASMAVIFGLVASLTILVLEPIISRWLNPEEPAQIVVFPEEQEEMSPEEMLAEKQPVQDPLPIDLEKLEIGISEEQVEKILSNVVLDQQNYKQLYSALSDYVNQLSKYMVTVTVVTSEMDLFHDVMERKNQVSGAVVAQNGKEILILAEAGSLKKAEKLLITFHNEISVEAEIKQQHRYSSLAILSVKLDNLPEEMAEMDIDSMVAPLGYSNGTRFLGTPVVALGSPMGTIPSIGYGIVASENMKLYGPDRNYSFIMTNIAGSQNAGGFLFNLQNEIVGIITANHFVADQKDLIGAYGITELKKVIEKMSNGQTIAYLGISGTDVTKEANGSLGVPYGAYIREIAMDSPAMLAGIQKGDVITEFDEKKITKFTDYSSLLMQMEPEQVVKMKVMRKSKGEYKEMNYSLTLGKTK